MNFPEHQPDRGEPGEIGPGSFEDTYDFGRKVSPDRSFPRVPVSFPVRFTVISEQEYEELYPVYMASPTSDRQGLDKAPEGFQVSPKAEAGTLGGDILERLDSIEKKLDYLLGIESPSEESRSREMPGEVGYARDISGAGLLVAAHHVHSLGWCLNIKVNIETPYPLKFNALCRIVRLLPPGDRSVYEMGCEFSAIHEKDLEEVNSFVYKRQRELARNRRPADH